MPLKKKYERILERFRDEYGYDKGTTIFYRFVRARKWKID